MSLRAVSYTFNRFVLKRRFLMARVPRYGFHMRVVTQDVVGRHIYKYGVHEREITEFLCREIDFRDGDAAIDVGANIGWYSLILNRIADGKDVRIVSFEPDPENYTLLTENLERNDASRVTPVQRAVADQAGTMTLHLFNDKNRGRHSLLPINAGESIDIETITLDRFWQAAAMGDRRPAFIKMDIEGFELVALRGAHAVLGRCPFVMLEYSPRYMRAGGLEPAELFQLMAGHGHAPYRLENGSLRAADVAELLSGDRHTDLFWRNQERE